MIDPEIKVLPDVPDIAHEAAERIVAAAERALRANWELLDGVEQFAGTRS